MKIILRKFIKCTCVVDYINIKIKSRDENGCKNLLRDLHINSSISYVKIYFRMHSSAIAYNFIADICIYIEKYL